MKSLKMLFLLPALLALGFSGFAQNPNSGWNGNAVISEVRVYDMGTGTGLVEVRVSGNQASTVAGGTVRASGPAIPGGSAFTMLADSRAINPHEVILTGSFPLMPARDNNPVFVDLDIEIQYRLGTKSKVNGSFKTFQYR